MFSGLMTVSAILLSLSAKAESLTGKYTYNWMDSKASKCQKIGPALNKKLSKMKCGPSAVQFADEKPALSSCKDKKETTEFLVYATAKHCNQARDNEQLNEP